MPWGSTGSRTFRCSTLPNLSAAAVAVGQAPGELDWSPTRGDSPSSTRNTIWLTSSVLMTLRARIHRWLSRTTPGPSFPSASQSPAMGMSPAAPNSKDRVPSPLRRGTIHVRPRTTPGSSTPSPFQSPTTGMSPVSPNAKVSCRPVESRQFHTPSRNVAMSAFPSPSRWPVSGISPSEPKEANPSHDADPTAAFVTSQSPPVNTPGVATPSPFQSAMSGTP